MILMIKVRRHVFELQCLNIPVPLQFFRRETNQLYSFKLCRLVCSDRRIITVGFQVITLTSFSEEKIKYDRASAASQTEIRGFAI